MGLVSESGKINNAKDDSPEPLNDKLLEARLSSENKVLDPFL